MQSLFDELRADQDPRVQCATCRWIESRPQAEQKAWDTAMADRSYTHASIHRAVQRRIDTDYVGPRPGRSSIENHRGNVHRQAPG